MARNHAELDAIVQELPQGISQEASLRSLKYEVGNIPHAFLMPDMWDI